MECIRKKDYLSHSNWEMTKKEKEDSPWITISPKVTLQSALITALIYSYRQIAYG
jgi:hypothetical protein